jgi:hypothetical protein
LPILAQHNGANIMTTFNSMINDYIRARVAHHYETSTDRVRVFHDERISGFYAVVDDGDNSRCMACNMEHDSEYETYWHLYDAADFVPYANYERPNAALIIPCITDYWHDDPHGETIADQFGDDVVIGYVPAEYVDRDNADRITEIRVYTPSGEKFVALPESDGDELKFTPLA